MLVLRNNMEKLEFFSSDFTLERLANSRFENYRNNFRNIKNSKVVNLPYEDRSSEF